MFSIDTIGQGILQSYQQLKAPVARGNAGLPPVTDENADKGENENAGTGRGETDLFGAALLFTLQKYGLDPEQFQLDFMAAMRQVNRGESADARLVAPHINTLG